MATMTISDLRTSRALDYKAMSALRGGAGAPWVFQFRPAFEPEAGRIVPIVNNFQIDNLFVADQLNVQFQTIEVNTFGDDAVVKVIAGQNASNVSMPALPKP